MSMRLSQPSLAHPAPSLARPPSPWLVLALVSLPVFIGALDLTIISAILPEVIVEFQIPLESGLDDTAWLVSGYLLAYTISMTFMGRVSDLIGRRRAYLICLAIFTAGSIWVAVADGLPAGWLYNLARRLGQRPDPTAIALLSLVIGRVIQAFGGGALVPISMALVGDLFPPQRRAQPLGLIGAIDMAGWVVGHLYGGIMVQFVDWRLLFWLNIPISLLIFALILRLLRGVEQPLASGGFDLPGALSLALALLCFSIGLGANTDVTVGSSTFAELTAFPPYAGPALMAGLAALLGFLWIERRHPHPLIDLGLFRRGNFAAGNLTSLIVGFALMIGLVIVPILINIRAESLDTLTQTALSVGLVMSALTIPMALSAIPGGWLSDRFGYRLPTATGLIVAAMGFTLAGLRWTEAVSHEEMAAHMILAGIGLGLTMSPTSAAVLNAAPDDRRGIAAAIDDMLRLLGMTLAASALTTIALRRISTLAATAIGETIAMTQEAVNIYVMLTAQVIRELALLGALLCLLALIPALLLRGGQANTQP
ncbi:MAG: MFS transporter [Anaerolineae bacterium]|nr:MFS transporter [Anaerolineae bacterium]